jgi:hypothetical protein
MTIKMEINNNNNANSGDVDPTINWYWDTKPFVVMRYFAREEVTDDEIEMFLETHQIETLQDLKTKLKLAGSLIPDEKFPQFCEDVIKCCKRIKETPEIFLAGEDKALYDETTILDNAYYTYSAEAVSVVPSKLGSRSFNFTLVLGPSGSGKTLFALRRLPSLIFTGDESSICRVQFRTRLAYEKMTPSKVSFPEAVAMHVQRCITDRLSKSDSLIDVTTIDLALHVILDEAGKEAYRDLFDTADKIILICNALRDNMRYKFKMGVHVTVVGTGLELSTLEIDSTKETTKFKMQPWTVKNFDKLVDVSNYPAKSKVKQVVRRFPILVSLVANARCAYILLKAMPESELLERKNWIKSSLNSIITQVVHHYIESNALIGLEYPDEKWEVIRSVFQEINKATSNPKVAFYPRFTQLSRALRGVAFTLIDVATETSNGKLVLRRNITYSVSMSTALFIVASVLLQANTEASWDWQRFESTVALGEWQRMVAQSKDKPTFEDSTIVQMPFPVPANNPKKSMAIPKVNQFRVVINGPGAPYADMMAPFRLVQAKFSATSITTYELDLQDELNQMGLTNSTHHAKQQALTSVLYCQWNSRRKVPAATKVVTKQLPAQESRSVYFPCDTLIGKFVSETPAVETYQIHSDCVTAGKMNIRTLMAFDKHQPVTAVLSTNCMAFVLNSKKPQQESVNNPAEISSDDLEQPTVLAKETEQQEFFRIDQNDVDWQGKLKSKVLPEDAAFGLREHVEIRFLFVSSGY